ncbi:MAG: C69 family dipeptidase [Bacteroidales bacterium]|nr:C69 family dipeptidase [Bacteroidales bacterium]
MQKHVLLTIAMLFSGALAYSAGACTNVLVTKGASADGSNMISYAADSHALFGELYFHPACIWQQGDMLEVTEWDTGASLTSIPQVARTFQTVGNMNEKQLIIGETTYGGRSELWDEEGLMDYGSMIYIALQRCSTAREAIRTMVDLATTYGYRSEGESFSVADKDEVWIFELIGKGPGRKGVVWVARRVPDGYICAHANQARISTFPKDDPENCMYAEDVIDFAREMGFYKGSDEDFSFCDAYAPLDFGAMRGCESRAWSAFNILCDGEFTYLDEKGNEVSKNSYCFIDYAMGYNKSKRFPLFVRPSRKITVKDVADVMRDHFEGTPMDMTTDIGAGGNALPYRWRPMDFKYKGKEYVNERAIATQQTGFWFVAQSRPDLPDEIGSLLWFGTDDAATSYLTPIYVCTREIPECFRVGNGDMLTYSPTSSFWINNRVSNACYKAYNIMQPTVRAKIDAWEAEMAGAVAKADAEALALYEACAAAAPKMIKRNDTARKSPDAFSSVKDYLTEFSVSNADRIFNDWVALEEFLLVKFIDGNVKAQNPDGSWVTNGNGNIPADISQPGYTDKWKAAVVKDHGRTLKVK